MTARKKNRTTGSSSKNKKALTPARIANMKLDAELKAAKAAREAEAAAKTKAKKEAEAKALAEFVTTPPEAEVAS